MRNKIKKIILATVISTIVCVPAQGVWAAETEVAELFSDGSDVTESNSNVSESEISDSEDATGSVSAFASALAKQTEEQTQEYMEKEEEAAQIREERRVEEAKKKAAEEAEAQRVAKRQELINFALQFEGNPYVYGGTSLTNGADCSGFVMSVFANFGYSLPRVAADQCAASTKKDVSQIEPGDLVFYGNGYVDHVALYIGDGKIIHASGAATGIKISNYDYQQPAAIGTFME